MLRVPESKSHRSMLRQRSRECTAMSELAAPLTDRRQFGIDALAEQFSEFGGIGLPHRLADMGGRIASAVPIEVRAAFAPAASIVFGDGRLQNLATVGPGHPLLASPDREAASRLRASWSTARGRVSALCCAKAQPITGEAEPVQKMQAPLYFRVRRFGCPRRCPFRGSPWGQGPCCGTANRHRSVSWRRRRLGTVVVIGEKRSV